MFARFVETDAAQLDIFHPSISLAEEMLDPTFPIMYLNKPRTGRRRLTTPSQLFEMLPKTISTAEELHILVYAHPLNALTFL